MPDKAPVGYGENFEKLAERFHQAGREAVPALFSSLKDERKVVREQAAFILSKMPGLGESDLDALMEAERKGGDYSPLCLAIGRIGTPRAVDFLVGELVRRKPSLGELPDSLVALGPLAVPALVSVYEDRSTVWDARLEDAMKEVFHKIGPGAERAVDPLLKIACDNSAQLARRMAAIRALGAIGPPAIRAASPLKKLSETTKSGELREASAEAIIDTGSPEAVPFLLRRLELAARPRKESLSKSADVSLAGLVWSATAPADAARLNAITDITWLGTNGVAAGPALVRLLDSKDWDEREAAAYALGEIGYREAVGKLISSLDNEEDWRLAYAAARSLGHLRAEQALPVLAKVAKDHWYPPVRAMAAHAEKLIAGEEERTWPSAREELRRGFTFRPGYFTADVWPDMERVRPDEELTLPISPESTQPVMIPSQVGGKWDKLTMTGESQLFKGVKVENGYLMGVAAREVSFLGLSFVDKHGIPHPLSDAIAPVAFYATKSGPVMVGVAWRPSGSCAMVYRFDPTKAASWEAKPWRVLPGYDSTTMAFGPGRVSALLKDGRIFVNCENGGLVTISTEGKMEMMTREEAIGGKKEAAEK